MTFQITNVYLRISNEDFELIVVQRHDLLNASDEGLSVLVLLDLRASMTITSYYRDWN